MSIQLNQNVSIICHAHFRHLFLYQKSLLVCKKQENTGDYSFKLELPLESLQINEERGKLNRFTLVSKTGRFLQVSVMTRDSKISWIREIKRAITTLHVRICKSFTLKESLVFFTFYLSNIFQNTLIEENPIDEYRQTRRELMV